MRYCLHVGIKKIIARNVSEHKNSRVDSQHTWGEKKVRENQSYDSTFDYKPCTAAVAVAATASNPEYNCK